MPQAQRHLELGQMPRILLLIGRGIKRLGGARDKYEAER